MLFRQILQRILVSLIVDQDFGFMQKTPNKMAATKKVILRTINLFLLGLVLQGYLKLFCLTDFTCTFSICFLLPLDMTGYMHTM